MVRNPEIRDVSDAFTNYTYNTSQWRHVNVLYVDFWRIIFRNVSHVPLRYVIPTAVKRDVHFFYSYMYHPYPTNVPVQLKRCVS